MKKRTIPRKVRAIIAAVAVLLLAAAYYIAKGCPALTFRQDFRRTERMNMVGPSQIVDRLSDEYSEFDDMMVGETEYGVCFFGRDACHRSSIFEQKEYIRYFSYREKTGDITVLAAPNYWGSTWDEFGISIPVYIFCDYPDAVRAELKLSVTGSRTEIVSEEKQTTAFTETFTGKAELLESGVLRCFLESNYGDGTTGYALALLSNVCTNYHYIDETAMIPCTIRLYDAEDNLIIEKDLIIRSDSGEALNQ